jgi:hypothetical protein
MEQTKEQVTSELTDEQKQALRVLYEQVQSDIDDEVTLELTGPNSFIAHVNPRKSGATPFACFNAQAEES